MPDDPYGPRVDDPWVPDDPYSTGSDSSLSTEAVEPKVDSEPFWRSESWLLEPLADDPAPPANTSFDWGSGADSDAELPTAYDSPATWDTSPAWESPAWDTNSMWETTTPVETPPPYDTGAYDVSTGSYATTPGFETTAYDSSSAYDTPDAYDAPTSYVSSEEPDPAPVAGAEVGYEPPVAYDTSAAFEPTAAYDPPAEIDWDALGKDDVEPVNWSDLYNPDGAESWASSLPDADESAPADAEEPPATAHPSLPRDNPHHEKGLDPRAVSTNATDFAAQKTSTSNDEPPTAGLPSFVYRFTGGHVRMKPTKEEQVRRRSVADIRRSIGGLRQITFTNPKGGSGKTTAALLTSMTLGQLRGGYILAWDNNETQGTLGVRARPDHHANTVRDLIADLPSFSGPVPGRVGDLAKYIRSQGNAMYDVLASDEQATAGEMMTAAAFQAVREVVGRFYKLICVDTGNNVRAANWAAAIDSTDQLVVTSSVRWESAYSASRMLDYLEQSGRGDLVANAVTVLTMPRSIKGLNLPQVETHFGVRTREVLHAPFDPQLDNGDQIRMSRLSDETRQAWMEIAAAITRGL